MRRCWITIVLLCFCIPLTGCWDTKDLEDYNFVSALGIERVNQKYVVYTEILDVASVGKNESGSTNESKSAWVGKAEGDTVIEAMSKIYKTSQQRLMWDHIVVLILSDTLLKEDMGKILGGVFRFREIRYTPWLFIAKGSIARVLENPPFINESPMATLSHRPDEVFKQWSPFIPIRMLSFSRYYQEPGATLLIPSLRIDEDTWKNEQKPQPVLTVDGAYSVQQTNAVWLSNDQLKGIRWMSPSISRTSVPIKHGEQSIGSVKIGSPHTKIKVTFSNGRPMYTMMIRIKGYIQELTDDGAESQLKADIEQEIKSGVIGTYKEAIAKQADIYQLEHYLYTKHNKEWNQLKSKNQSRPDADSLAKVDVNVQLTHSGIYQLD